MRQDKVAYMHFRHYNYEGDLQPKGGLTLAYQLIYENEEIAGIAYALALCNSKDHYNKRIGKLISGGRIAKFPMLSDIRLSTAWFDEIENGILESCTADDGCKLVNTSRGKAVKAI